MGYGQDEWRSRIANRSDFTTSLVHLTRENGDSNALDVLFKILGDKRLVGSSTSSGFIVGKKRAVCFQEAPIYSLAQNIYTEQQYRKSNTKAKVRYVGFGLQFSKSFVFGRGGRPVIYDNTASAKAYLPEDQWWRIVSFDLQNKDSIVDWCHEREWRVAGDLEFELGEVCILLPNPLAYRRFVKQALDSGNSSLLTDVGGIVQLGSVFF